MGLTEGLDLAALKRCWVEADGRTSKRKAVKRGEGPE